ncbi:hypothetical protein DAPPUDRAFT_249535 [Daphnia pulex]|uniref:E3 ubiquitin-protein ligase n=1 Tax=Daphnia pulex TaxID=6669 RepID=E9GWV2_DAPPU|nr:hypothetical protein DAPPUDRAFT_249535 [Daphnia pulex]|eukprot:EFX76055.1 hypothetical protein DAPPUDRAFT_249535 [Daphnia pulex]
MSGDAGKWRGLYVELMAKFCLERGIHRQEFNHVFTMSRLAGFSPSELQLLLCGDQSPSWTREDILNYWRRSWATPATARASNGSSTC